MEKFDISRDPADRVPIQSRPVRGNPSTKVTIVSFDDLECPFCAEMHAELFPATAERYFPGVILTLDRRPCSTVESSSNFRVGGHPTRIQKSVNFSVD
jgi:Thioredoxin